MLTDTTDRPKHNNNPKSWKKLTAIGAIAAVALLTGAVAPARSQPGTISNELVKLLASDGAANDWFGYSVDISGDTALVSAVFNDNVSGSGSAYVFARDATGIWTLESKLIASDAAVGDRFGESVAISGDTIVIGAIRHEDNGIWSGSAYIFNRDAGGVWSQQAKLLPDDGALGDQFGVSVAISGDTAVVGAHTNDDACPSDLNCNSGSAYIFVRDAAGVWTQQAKLIASDTAAGDLFGFSAEISGDTAIVGALRDGDNGPDSGSAYIFVRDAAGAWTQQAKLLPNDGAADDQFGRAVAVDSDTVVIGAFTDDDSGLDSGSAYVFERDGAGAWTQKSKLIASDAAVGDEFGFSVALSSDTVLVGALRGDGNVSNSGAAYVFTQDTAGVWTQSGKLGASTGESSVGFGWVVSISAAVAFIGEPGGIGNAINSGLAYVFNLGSPADFNGDGVVNAADLASLLAQWGCLAPANCQADLNGDGTVDAADLAQLLASWG